MELDLATTLPAMTWVINAYTLCMSAFADRRSRRRSDRAAPDLLTGLAFRAGSVAAARAASGVLILARASREWAPALLIPCSLAIIGAASMKKSAGAAIGVWSGASAITAERRP